MFEKVTNVIVDEAQHFKSRDGDWYAYANGLTLDARKEKLKPKKSGYFWVFMDYSQKVHKFNAGLPSVVGHNNFMLSEVTRNSKEIFDYAMHFMKAGESCDMSDVTDSGDYSNQHDLNSNSDLHKVESVPVLGHEYSSGQNVDVVSCKKQNLVDTISRVLSGILKEGVDINDIAILVSKKKDKEEITPDLQSISQQAGVTSPVMVDTLKGFSGMDKSTIIGINPDVNQKHASLDKYMYNLATRAKDSLVIISSNENSEDKLKFHLGNDDIN